MRIGDIRRIVLAVAGVAGLALALAAASGPVAAEHHEMNPCDAEHHEMNPCDAEHHEMNPCDAKPLNPCAANPCAANPCGANVCNPCDAAKNPCDGNPCNPCAGNPCAANPCAANPCGGNPCNPCGGNPCNPCGGASVDPSRFQQPEGQELAGGDRKALVERGGQLWKDRSLGESGLACSTCHRDGTAQMAATFAKPYPHRVAMPHQQAGVDRVNAAEMVNFCMIVPMNDEPLPWDSVELAALTAYVEHLQEDFAPSGANPCNPCGANPCNPCGANPCNPCGH